MSSSKLPRRLGRTGATCVSAPRDAAAAVPGPALIRDRSTTTAEPIGVTAPDRAHRAEELRHEFVQGTRPNERDCPDGPASGHQTASLDGPVAWPLLPPAVVEALLAPILVPIWAKLLAPLPDEQGGPLPVRVHDDPADGGPASSEAR